jgi:DNA-binding CsgD family transcriptional regulator
MLRITPSDREALRLLATGHSKDDVATGLGMTAAEVETQLRTLFAAMGVASEAEAIAAAHRRGLLPCERLTY